MGSKLGHRVSQETKDKIRATLSGHPVSIETRNKISGSKTGKITNRVYSTPSEVTKEKLRLANIGKTLSDETKNKISTSMKKAWENPDDRGRRIESLKKVWEDPEYRTRMSDVQMGHPVSNETKQKISEGHIELFETDPEYSQKRVESQLGGFWYGNVRYYDGARYCNKFNDSFRERVREFRGRVCFECGALENGQKLHVHHVHYDKKMCCNGSPRDMVPLCISCHAKTNRNRDYWEKRFTQKIYALDPSGKCFFDKGEILELNKILT